MIYDIITLMAVDSLSWSSIAKQILIEYGLWPFLFFVLLIMNMGYVKSMAQRNIDDKQKEIDRLAEDNRQYRDMFIKSIK